jgi:acetyl esterase/lipase
VYGKDSAQRMDIYLPANRSTATTKALILIHGGGWNGGDKRDFATYITAFQKRMPDYAIFNINYRLVNSGSLFPAQENDVKAAVDAIVDKAAYYGFNKEKMALLGASAGAHLALLQAYKYSTPKIAAVIDFFGPTDLTVMYQKPWHPLVPVALQVITGTTPTANSSIYKSSSPTNFISPGVPPTLIFHGERDNVVDVSQSQLLHQGLEKAGVANDLVIYPSERHGWYGKTLEKSFDKMQDFLKTHLP